MSNISVSITENGTTTLATAGKYCDKNVDVVVNVEGGGGGGGEVATLTGNLSQLFYNNKYSDFLNKCNTNVVATDVTSFSEFCSESHDLVRLPITNITLGSSFSNFSKMFYNCYKLTEVPPLTNGGIASSVGDRTAAYRFFCCYSLRSIPANYNFAQIYLHSFEFNGCYVLEEIKAIYLPAITTRSNVFSGAFANCNRLSRLTFVPNSYTGYSNQVIDLASYVGYTGKPDNITNHSNSHGITAATQVTDSATYEALKDNPDWWTASEYYSRYNHDSAVETLNSLPTMASNSGNTIKFKGSSGYSTDGGAIDTLTADEIAVATAKNWTVTLV